MSEKMLKKWLSLTQKFTEIQPLDFVNFSSFHLLKLRKNCTHFSTFTTEFSVPLILNFQHH